MAPELKAAIESTLGTTVRSGARVSGGDINQAFSVVLADEQRVFVKTNPNAPEKMFTLEARGLEWLRETGTVRVPRVLAVSESTPRFLILEYLEPRRRTNDYDQVLGRELAALHRAPAAGFGLDYDNFIANLPQSNDAKQSWAEFYVEERLRSQLGRAVSKRNAPAHWTSRFERLFAKLSEFVPNEPPQRLHGDLWNGNVHVGSNGGPCLIDPAVYAGHREVDLAMMRLFGGFGASVFAAYEEAFPLLPGSQERVALYQLYPLLVHVNLFGGSYVQQVEARLSRLP
jgi:fructosamine-3-kinase